MLSCPPTRIGIALRKVYADISKDCNNITFDQLKKNHTLRSQYVTKNNKVRNSYQGMARYNNSEKLSAKPIRS